MDDDLGTQMSDEDKNAESCFADEKVDGEEIGADEAHARHHDQDEGIQEDDDHEEESVESDVEGLQPSGRSQRLADCVAGQV